MAANTSKQTSYIASIYFVFLAFSGGIIGVSIITSVFFEAIAQSKAQDGVSNEQLLSEIKALREEVQLLRSKKEE